MLKSENVCVVSTAALFFVVVFFSPRDGELITAYSNNRFEVILTYTSRKKKSATRGYFIIVNGHNLYDAQKHILMAFFLLMLGIHARNVFWDITNCTRVDSTSESSNQGHSEIK